MAPHHEQTVECRTAALLDAAEKGDAQTLIKILDNTTSNNIKADAAQWTLRRLAPGIGKLWQGWSAQPGACALHLAAQNGHLPVLEALVHRNAQILQETRHGVTALHLACFGGHASAVELLLAHSANPRQRCRDLFGVPGPSPLHLVGGAANSNDSVKCALLLLRAGASADSVDECTGRTPLHYAVLQRCAPLCSCLLNAGAWVQMEDAGGETPLSLARREVDIGPSACSHGDDADERKAAAAAVVCELRWLPAVRTLWLGHLRTGAVVGGHAEGKPLAELPIELAAGSIVDDGQDGGSVGTSCVVAEAGAHSDGWSPFRWLSRDVVRLIVDFVIESHMPPQVVQEPCLKRSQSNWHNDDSDAMCAGLAELSLAIRTMHESGI